ncbi:unnamed protein product, partial [marine sediment metagenome]
NIYHTQLDDLQEAREQATGLEREEIQKKIDDIFFKNPPKKRQKKRKIKIKDPDDMWY